MIKVVQGSIMSNFESFSGFWRLFRFRYRSEAKNSGKFVSAILRFIGWFRSAVVRRKRS